jgi:hypothetical protein
MSDQELLERIGALAREERRITRQLLECLEEVERRGLHLQRGYGSLFAWACAELGYSEDQAQYRIDAMRALRDVPRARALLEAERISLSHLVRAQRFFIREKRAGKALSLEGKHELLESLQGCSTRECDRKIAERSSVPVFQERIRPLPGGRTEITFTASLELMADLDRLRSLWGCSSFEEVVVRLVRSSMPRDVQPVTLQPTKQVGDPPGEVLTPASRYIPRATRRLVWKRDEGRCSYTSPETGKRCNSTYALQVDHLQPYAMGGGHNPANLRLLCRAHNLWAARRVFNKN